MVYSQASPRQATVTTQIPSLYKNWLAATVGPTGTEADARLAAEAVRNQISRDPFTELFGLSCPERLKKGERVVWVDDSAMAIVDTSNRGGKLLVVPKKHAMFLFELNEKELRSLERTAAATCDGLIIAAGRQPSASADSCDISVHPPKDLGVKQLHVHVELLNGPSAPVDDDFRRRAAEHMRSLLGGGGASN